MDDATESQAMIIPLARDPSHASARMRPAPQQPQPACLGPQIAEPQPAAPMPPQHVVAEPLPVAQEDDANELQATVIPLAQDPGHAPARMRPRARMQPISAAPTLPPYSYGCAVAEPIDLLLAEEPSA